MRPRFIVGLVLGVATALASLAAGCAPAPPPAQPVRLRPLPAVDASAASPMFQIRLVVLSHRQRPDAPMEDIWRLLGTTNVPYEKRALWETNDLRLGDGARLAADRMNTLATETPDRTAQVRMLYARENFDFAIPLGGERDSIDFLWTDAAGELAGRHFDKAFAQLRCVCRSDPDDPTAVRLAIMPEILYGPEAMHWVQIGGSVTQKMIRASFQLPEMAAEVRFVPGRILVIGPRTAAPGGKGAPDLGLGSALMRERRGPDLWTQTIILTAERAAPGQVPEGGSIPLMPGLKPTQPKPTGPATVPPPAGTQPPAPGAPAQPGATPATPPKVRINAPNIPGLRIMPPTGPGAPPQPPPAAPAK
ncbi:MAG: hypothetical protein NTY65_12220 [Planctomycetota bacterium]|nr:hypothetical protein [Planctomycetota bacterium]